MINSGHFYYLMDQYFVDFPDSYLMKNKETIDGEVHDRPCFYAYKDNNTGIYWMIPFSSQVDKYKKYYNKKMEKYKRCDTIVFGDVLGHEKAFLIQNMCPITAEYVKNEYIDSTSKKPVQIDRRLEKELIEKAKKVLILQRKGIHLIFPDVWTIEQKLLCKKKELDKTYHLQATIMQQTKMSQVEANELIQAMRGDDTHTRNIQFGWFLKFIKDYDSVFQEHNYNNFILLLEELFQGRYCIDSCVDNECKGINIKIMPYNDKEQGIIVAIRKMSDCERMGLSTLAQNTLQETSVKAYCEEMRKKHIEEVLQYSVAFCCHSIVISTSIKYHFFH